MKPSSKPSKTDARSRKTSGSSSGRTRSSSQHRSIEKKTRLRTTASSKGSVPKFVSLHDEQPVGQDHELARITKKAMTETYDYAWVEPGRHSFRVSSFPYCPVIDLHDRVHEPVQIETFGKAFYTNVGTTVHEKLMQTYHLKSPTYGKSVYGSWKCKTCELQVGPCLHSKGKRLLHKKTKSPVCKNAGCNYEYVEMDFQFGEGSGHLDMLMFHNGRWLAWEFKTTGSFLFTAPAKVTSRFYPDPKHKVQIQTYCALLKICHGIEVDAYSIVYINRDKVEMNNPDKKAWSDRVNSDRWGFKTFTYVWNPTKHKLFEHRIQVAQQGRSAVQALVSQAKPLKSTVSQLLDARPCTSEAVYKGYMDAKFFNDKSCPYFDNGQCFKGDMRKVVKALHSKVQEINAEPMIKRIKKAERALAAKQANTSTYGSYGSIGGGISVSKGKTISGAGRKQMW